MTHPSHIDPAGDRELTAWFDAARYIPGDGRSPRDAEIAALEAEGNRCDDWSAVMVSPDFDPRCIRGCRLSGRVRIAAQAGTVEVDGVPEPCGVYNSTLHNVSLSANVVVRNVTTMADCHVAGGAVVIDCGTIARRSDEAFGIGVPLDLGLETGERRVAAHPRLTVEDAYVLAARRDDVEVQEAHNGRVAALAAAARRTPNIIGERAHVINVPRIESVAIGPCARVVGATQLRDCLLLSGAGEAVFVGGGSLVEESIVQWSARVDRGARVARSLIGEAAKVECGATVHGSLIGPCSEIGRGEVTASLIGPFVAGHHQSLLIGVLWPEGRGNVASGCQCGSNHTGRAPDQGYRPGEGAFLGLGSIIKFPGNLSDAPYSIIAPGVAVLPSRIAFPFSLINAPSCIHDGVPPTYPELSPGWVFGRCAYMLFRCEAKWVSRNRARRGHWNFDVFRREVMERVWSALARLREVDERDLYTERELPGLGKTVLTRRARKEGIAFYEQCVAFHALRAFQRRLRTVGAESDAAVDALRHQPSDDPEWEYARGCLTVLFDGCPTADVLQAWRELHAQVLAGVEQSKRRDLERGRRIQDDYDETHPPLERDPVWMALRDEAPY